jgi:hypothetical protein
MGDENPISNGIRYATAIQDMEAVFRLTHECYVAQGYVTPQSNGLLLHYPEHDVLPETRVLIAFQDGQVVGSASFTLSGREGLTICHDFLDECNAIEKEGRIIGAVWRLVIKETCRSSRQVLIGLLSELLRHGLRARVNTALIVVNPRHERVYQRLLNMQVVARKEVTGGLSNAPAVLLRCDYEHLPPEWKLAEAAIHVNEPLGLATLESLLDPRELPGMPL